MQFSLTDMKNRLGDTPVAHMSHAKKEKAYSKTFLEEAHEHELKVITIFFVCTFLNDESRDAFLVIKVIHEGNGEARLVIR